MKRDVRINDTASNGRALFQTQIRSGLLAEARTDGLASSEDQAVLAWNSAQLIKIVFDHLVESLFTVSPGFAEYRNQEGERFMDAPIFLKNLADQPSFETSFLPPSHSCTMVAPGGTNEHLQAREQFERAKLVVAR